MVNLCPIPVTVHSGQVFPMDNVFQGLPGTPEPIDYRLIIRITNSNGYENFLFYRDGDMPPDDIRIAHTGFLNTRAKTLRGSQETNIQGETAAIKKRIISQA
jgi:hypothetical protein